MTLVVKVIKFIYKELVLQEQKNDEDKDNKGRLNGDYAFGGSYPACQGVFPQLICPTPAIKGKSCA